MSKKDLLVITNSFPDKDDKHIGGIFVKEQLRYLAPHFGTVHVVFPSTFGQGHKPKEDFEDYSFGNVQVHFLSYMNFPLFLKVARGGFTYLMAKAIDRLIRREGIKLDIIHAHFTWPSGAAAVRLKRKHKVPVVVTEHTSLTFKKAVEAEDPQFVDTWLASDAVIRVREEDIGAITALGVPDERVHFMPNGFDGSKFLPMDKGECRKRLGLPADRKILVSVGGLEEVKGHRYLVDAMRKVTEKNKAVMCYIVGGGPLMSTLQAQIDTAGLAQNVKLVGPRPYSEMPYWMNSSDLVVHPSLSESGPMVMFEALGCGRPFIGTRVGSVPAVVTSDDLGLVCEPADEASLSDSILRGLVKGWSIVRISSYATSFTWDKVSGKVLAIYSDLLGSDI